MAWWLSLSLDQRVTGSKRCFHEKTNHEKNVAEPSIVQLTLTLTLELFIQELTTVIGSGLHGATVSGLLAKPIKVTRMECAAWKTEGKTCIINLSSLQQLEMTGWSRGGHNTGGAYKSTWGRTAELLGVTELNVHSVSVWSVACSPFADCKIQVIGTPVERGTTTGGQHVHSGWVASGETPLDGGDGQHDFFTVGRPKWANGRLPYEGVPSSNAAFSDYGSFTVYGLRCPSGGYSCEITTAKNRFNEYRSRALVLVLYDLHLEGPLKISATLTNDDDVPMWKNKVPRIMLLHQARSDGSHHDSVCFQSTDNLSSKCTTYAGAVSVKQCPVSSQPYLVDSPGATIRVGEFCEDYDRALHAGKRNCEKPDTTSCAMTVVDPFHFPGQEGSVCRNGMCSMRWNNVAQKVTEGFGLCSVSPHRPTSFELFQSEPGGALECNLDDMEARCFEAQPLLCADPSITIGSNPGSLTNSENVYLRSSTGKYVVLDGATVKAEADSKDGAQGFKVTACVSGSSSTVYLAEGPVRLAPIQPDGGIVMLSVTSSGEVTTTGHSLWHNHETYLSVSKGSDSGEAIQSGDTITISVDHPNRSDSPACHLCFFMVFCNCTSFKHF